MSFVERVKKILLEKNENEIRAIEERIQEVSEIHSIETEQVRRLTEESKAVSKERGQVQKNIISTKELKDLEQIYEFVASYPQIKDITKSIVHAAEMSRYAGSYEIYSEDPEILWNEEVLYRERLSTIVENLNRQIEEIINSKYEEVEQETVQETIEPPKKLGFFARLFARKKKALPEPENTINSTVARKGKNIFNEYRRTIKDFKDNCSSFLVVNLDGPTVIDRNISARLITNVNNLTVAKKRGFELEEEDESYLDFMQPLDLWREISKYYVGTTLITTIIKNFERNIDRFEKLYQERPELFNVQNLKRIFDENNQKVLDLRAKSKTASSKSNEVAKKKQEEREVRTQLRLLENKLKTLKEKKKKLTEAKSLEDFGYKSKEEAARKLSIDTKDYIVIPIPKGVLSISELFQDEKKLKIEVDQRTFFAVYSNDIATGKINFLERSKDFDAVLMVPIAELEKEDVDNVRTGKIGLNSSVLMHENLFIIHQEGREFDLEGYDIKKTPIPFGRLDKYLKEFLGEDYATSSDETGHYSIFKGIQAISSKEKRLRKEAVKRCVVESVEREISSKDAIYVNGKTFFVNKDDELEMLQAGKAQSLDEPKIMKIVDEIEDYLIVGKKHPAQIDLFYKKFLMEYMRVNPKAKADYYGEEKSTVLVGDREISIKPVLPAKNEMIAKRYSRVQEDIAYKTMKLASLVNRFAHLTDNQKLQDSLFDLKLDLIEDAIDLSQGNPNVKLKRRFDEKKMVTSVSMEIPGYNMIALHTKNKGRTLSFKANRLEEAQGEVLQSSTLLIPGVSKELLMTMKGMKEEERTQFLVDLEPTVFYKLALRMGYTSDSISTDEERKKFIRDMTSDKKIEELMKETDELEK